MILVDGVPTAAVHATDRGLGYGDGVFRTMRVRGGIALQWARHYAKLASDCSAIGIRCPAQALLAQEIERTCDGATPEHTVKIVVTRGAGPRGYAYADDLQPTRLVYSAPYAAYPPEYASAGVCVRRCRLTLAVQPALAGIKHLNRLENVLARAEWSDPALAEGLLCDAAGNLIGGTMTNVFIAKDGALSTPALTRCGVAGVTRDRVIDAAHAHGVACSIRDIGWDELSGAEEVILVNSLAGAWPVREIDGVALKPGPVVRTLQKWLDDA